MKSMGLFQSANLPLVIWGIGGGMYAHDWLSKYTLKANWVFYFIHIDE